MFSFLINFVLPNKNATPEIKGGKQKVYFE
jgi:hypothetical protein